MLNDKDGLHPSSGRTFYKRCFHDSEDTRLENSVAKGPRIGIANADLLYQSRGKGAERLTPCRAGKSESPSFQANTQNVDLERMWHDSKTKIGRVQVVLEKEKRSNRKAPQFGYVQNTATGRTTRARRTVFQASLSASHPLKPQVLYNRRASPTTISSMMVPTTASIVVLCARRFSGAESFGVLPV